MSCSLCGFKLLERIYTFKCRDDEDNLCCSNISCKTYSDEIILFDIARKVKYFCVDCGRTLLFENNKIFGSKSLADGWLYLNGYGDENDKNVKCSKCEDYVLGYKNYKNCDFCGKIYKGDCYHETLKFVDFIQNENNEKCFYCDRYLMKCKLCDNACYVCVFNDCLKSQKTGNSIESYFGLCETCTNDDTSLKKYVKISNVQCDNCGLKKYWHKADCVHFDDVLVCNNCDGNRLICCYDCY